MLGRNKPAFECVGLTGDGACEKLQYWFLVSVGCCLAADKVDGPKISGSFRYKFNRHAPTVPQPVARLADR